MKREEPSTWTSTGNRERQKRKRSFPREKRQSDLRWYGLICLLFVGAFAAVFYWPSDLASEGRTNNLTVVPVGEFACQVSSITDGDTLRCSDGTRVRLHAVAARESDETCSPGHPCPSASAASATAKLSQLAGGQTLQCDKTGTSYYRVTAICRNEGNVEINCAMVRSGTTVIWPRFNSERAICS